jgi:hypothetical protein
MDNASARQALRDRLQDRGVSHKDVAPQPVAPRPSTSKINQSASQQVAMLSGDEIRRVVTQSRIPLRGGVSRVERVSGPDFAAFQWDTGTVYGSGEQSRLADMSAFESSVARYINKTQQRCDASFDQTVQNQHVNGLNVKTADIACVDARGEGQAASVLFFAYNGMFYALAHEADMNSFQTAMDMRDRLLKGLATAF